MSSISLVTPKLANWVRKSIRLNEVFSPNASSSRSYSENGSVVVERIAAWNIKSSLPLSLL